MTTLARAPDLQAVFRTYPVGAWRNHGNETSCRGDGSGRGRRSKRGSRDFREGRAPGFAEKLPKLPSAGTGRADVAADLREHEALGEGDQSGRAHREDAAVVRGPAIRAFYKQPGTYPSGD